MFVEFDSSPLQPKIMVEAEENSVRGKLSKRLSRPCGNTVIPMCMLEVLLTASVAARLLQIVFAEI